MSEEPVTVWRRCGPCRHSFHASRQEAADAMYDEHIVESHPEAAALIEVTARLEAALAELRKESADPSREGES